MFNSAFNEVCGFIAVFWLPVAAVMLFCYRRRLCAFLRRRVRRFLRRVAYAILQSL